jgi:hypothetical protein
MKSHNGVSNRMRKCIRVKGHIVESRSAFGEPSEALRSPDLPVLVRIEIDIATNHTAIISCPRQQMQMEAHLTTQLPRLVKTLLARGSKTSEELQPMRSALRIFVDARNLFSSISEDVNGYRPFKRLSGLVMPASFHRLFSRHR